LLTHTHTRTHTHTHTHQDWHYTPGEVQEGVEAAHDSRPRLHSIVEADRLGGELPNECMCARERERERERERKREKERHHNIVAGRPVEGLPQLRL